MTEHLLGLELAHWLIIAGLVLVVLELLGMVVRPRKQSESQLQARQHQLMTRSGCHGISRATPEPDINPIRAELTSL